MIVLCDLEHVPCWGFWASGRLFANLVRFCTGSLY